MPDHRGATDAGDDVVGIVIAAGSSRRLGVPKQTLPFGDTSVLGWVVRNAEQSALDRVLVVLGGAADEALLKLDLTTASTVINDNYRSGPLSSLQSGLAEAGDCAAVMMLLGDMPGVDAAVIDTVLRSWRHDPSWAAVTSYTERLGHPIMFSAESVPTVRALRGDKAVWKMIHGEPETRVRHMEIDQPCPGDIDTWDDYLEVGEQLGAATSTERPKH